MEHLYSTLRFDWYFGWVYSSRMEMIFHQYLKNIALLSSSFQHWLLKSEAVLFLLFCIWPFFFFTWKVCGIFFITIAFKFHIYIPIFIYLFCKWLCGFFQPWKFKPSVLGNLLGLFHWWSLLFSLFLLSGTPVI